jgi:hypothetical protein
MSFVPGFAPDALSQWRELDFDLQELVLDEVDKLANDPPARDTAIIDLAHDLPTGRHYLFIQLLIDHPRGRVVVIGVGHHFRAN